MSSMNQRIFCLISIFILNSIININLVNASCQGCVELDVLSFDKILAKFPYSLVKFDIAFPYGEKHEEFGKFAKNYVKKLNSELLVALVGIKDYGDKDNSELGERFSIDKENYPGILIFKNTTLQAKWPEKVEINYKNIKQFIRDNTELYIGLDGCIGEFDEFASEFIVAGSDTEKKDIISKARKRAEIVKNTSMTYVIAMEKIFEKGNKFISEEMNRLKKLYKSKISAAKKNEIGHKINIISMFEKLTNKKDEL